MFGINPIEWVAGFSPEWAVFFLSMLPITELRASIPIGLGAYKMPVIQTWLIAVLGNMTPTVFVLLLLPKLHEWLIKQKFIGHVLKRKLSDAEKYFSGKYFKYGSIALVLFVGIPLPFTGAWTGSLAAFVFNIPFKKSFPLILIGVCLAATLVTLITLFASGALRWLF
ncbi:small multi-drug export protein [Patescibacteria group bacterium]|nr:small multi-drug export protein [Patescibacteria group bacterium]MBU1895692.1 small multi-drug export protein [Patescibacteria group bacterium]